MATNDNLVDQEFDLPAAPEHVWKALVDADIAARWMLPEQDAAGEADAPAEPADLRVDLLDADPGRRVSYRWREGDRLDSIVTFSILPDAVGGTRLRIVQTETLPVAMKAVAKTPGPVAVSGAARCRISFASGRQPFAANGIPLLRAA